MTLQRSLPSAPKGTRVENSPARATRPSSTVGKFEEEFAATWGIGVQVANADDTKLADNGATLVAAGK